MKKINLLVYLDLILCATSIGIVSYLLYIASPLIEIGTFMLVGSNSLIRLLDYGFGASKYFFLGMSVVAGILLISGVESIFYNQEIFGATLMFMSLIFVWSGLMSNKENHIY
jgi:hypothetical protein